MQALINFKLQLQHLILIDARITPYAHCTNYIKYCIDIQVTHRVITTRKVCIHVNKFIKVLNYNLILTLS